MNNLLGSIVGNELFFVYGLIALVIVLIIVIIILDKRESKKKPQNLFDTLNMKIIADPNSYTNESTKVESSEVSLQPEIIEVEQQIQEKTFHDLEPIPEVKTFSEVDLKGIADSNDDQYIESELEKTQAQLRVEEITAALKKAQVEEKIQEDKYAKFEEEQEKNAIISYNELKESFDRLYSENEKIQYLEDDEIPINIDELYQLSNQQEDKKKEELPKAKLEDLTGFATSKQENQPVSNSTFKSSPLISPVYGIQKPPVQVKSTVDTEIQDANQFLQNLKELKNNLD